MECPVKCPVKVLAQAVSLALALAFLLAPRPASAQESCTTCHGELGLVEAGRIHARSGIECVSCHGGVPGAMTVEGAHAGSFAVPRDGRAMALHCGSCHSDQERMRGYGVRTDQLLLYWTSDHGQRLLAEPDAPVATCVSCHGSHGVLPAHDPRAPTHPRNQPDTCGSCHSDAALMEPFGLPADSVARYRDSVHGQALLQEGRLSSPACADCHGAHGATPPRVEAVGRVCGKCHVPAVEAFWKSPHRDAAASGAMDECISCHGSHGVGKATLDMLVGDEPGHCGQCHASGSGARAVGVAVHGLLAGFDQALGETRRSLGEAALGGIFVERQAPWLEQAQALRSRAAPLAHTLDPRALEHVLGQGEGLIGRTRDGLEDERRALRDRRIFVGLFAGVVLLMAAGLLLHAREVGRRATGAVGRRAGSRGGGTARD